MRVVLDTNVIVSGTIGPLSVPARILRAWDDQRFDLLVSRFLLAEYRRALGYEHVRRIHQLTDAEVDDLVDYYERGGVLVEPEPTLAVITADPDDNRVLECAEAGGATHIVSGDRHLLTLGAYQGIRSWRRGPLLSCWPATIRVRRKKASRCRRPPWSRLA